MELSRQQGISRHLRLFLRRVIGPDRLDIGISECRCRSAPKPEGLALGLQVAKRSPKGLAAGTRDGLHTSIIGPVQAAAAPPWPRSRVQFQLDALNKYETSNPRKETIY